MKGLSFAIEVVVVAIVLIVVALVVITIFGTGIGTVQTITSAKNSCRTAAVGSCSSAQNLPLTWNDKNSNVEGTYRSCADLLPGCRCTGNSASSECMGQ